MGALLFNAGRIALACLLISMATGVAFKTVLAIVASVLGIVLLGKLIEFTSRPKPTKRVEP
jgi:uncharacterized membrane protein